MLINGIAQSHLPAADRSTQYGDGCFTTILIEDHTPQFMPAHLQRLKLACERLFIRGVDWQRLERDAVASAASMRKGVIKVLISRGEGGRGYAASGNEQANVVISTAGYPEHYSQWQQAGIRLGVSDLRLSIQPYLAGLKHNNRLEQVLIKRQLGNMPVDDVVVLDTNGHIVEASAANLFWFDGQSWFTPTLDKSGVAGVMRNQILSLLNKVDKNSANQHEVIQGSWPLNALESAQSALICNSLMGIVPVNSLMSTQFNNHHETHFSKAPVLALQALFKGACTDESHSLGK